MAHLRLVGLVLFITAILLALAAAATKTTHIRVQRFGEIQGTSVDPAPNWLPEPRQPADELAPPSANLPPPPRLNDWIPAPVLPRSELPEQLPDWSPDQALPDGRGGTLTDQPADRFMAVPVVWPLLATAGTGLLLWFSHPNPLQPTRSKRGRRRR